LLTSGAATVLAQASASSWETIEAPAPARCSDGSAYSFHVRRADPERLLLFFNGGGACWDATTCDPQGSPSYRVSAGPGSGNDPREYNGAFALDNPENPFRDWSQVFVSYCSGDVHLGDRASEYAREDGSSFTVEHRGRRNADAVLKHVTENFAPERILVAGGSAGAIASPVYATVVAEAYPDAEVIQFAGGAAGYRIPPPTALWERWGTIGALPRALDASDADAKTLQMLDFYRLAAKAKPELRFYTWDNAYDAVQERFLALLGAPGELLLGLNANLRKLRSEVPTLRSYIAPGEFHTVLRYEELYSRSSDGVRAVEWIGDLTEGRDPGNVHCAPYCDDP
ncbi:MAG: pectin acetylesterase-family hydrolase, partial [Pseudomonadota bacterium]